MLNRYKGVKSPELSTNTTVQIFIDFISLWHGYLKFVLSCLDTHVSLENFAKLVALCLIQDQVHLLWKNNKWISIFNILLPLYFYWFKSKQNICLQIEFLCLLSLTRVYLIIKGDRLWVRCQWPLCSPPILGFWQVTWTCKPCACHSSLLLRVRSCFSLPPPSPDRPTFSCGIFSVGTFFLARTFTGQTYYNRIHSFSVCFNKSRYGPIVHSHIAPT